MKTKKEIVELTKVCKEILKVSKKYEYLWEDIKLIPGRAIKIFNGAYHHEEAHEIYVYKTSDDKFYFYRPGLFGCSGADAKEAAEEMLKFNTKVDEPVTAEKLRQGFYKALKEPLGKYLANKELEELLK